MNLLLTAVVAGIVAGSVTALLGAGLVVVHRATGIVDFAHGALATVAVFVMVSLTAHRVPLWAALPAGLVTGALLGGGVHLLVMRPLADRPSLTGTVASLGVLYALQGLTLAAFGGAGRAVPSAFPHGGIDIGGIVVSWSQLGVVVTAVAVTAACGVVLARTAAGRRLRAVADDPGIAALTGVDVDRVRAGAWTSGGGLAALAGILVTPSLGLDSYTLTLLVVQGLAAALTGRLRSLSGALAGGVGIGVTTSLVRTGLQRSVGTGPAWVNLAATADVVAVVWIAVLLLRWGRHDAPREQGTAVVA